MKKRWKQLTALVLTAAALLPTAQAAHDHPGTSSSEDDNYVYSAWAKEEAQRAEAAGFTVSSNYGDYTTPISRNDFRYGAMSYVMVNQDQAFLPELVEYYLAEKDADGNMKLVFQDKTEDMEFISATDRDNSIAYYLGLVEGRSPGHFDPDALVTRQEAAVMLARAYRVLDKELPEEAEELPFTDADEIADWAKDSVALLYTWNVLLGRDDGSFDPQGSFTAEQCLITLLRLYENAPVSRKQGNVEQMFTYQQVMELFEHIFTEDNGEIVMSRWDGPGVTALRTMLYGRYSITDTIFVYQDGRCRLVDLGLCNFMGISLNSTAKVTDAAFSEDGSLFRCTVTLPYDSVGRNDSDGVVHQAGIYHVTVDVGTLEATQTWEPLPS